MASQDCQFLFKDPGDKGQRAACRKETSLCSRYGVLPCAAPFSSPFPLPSPLHPICLEQSPLKSFPS